MAADDFKESGVASLSVRPVTICSPISMKIPLQERHGFHLKGNTQLRSQAMLATSLPAGQMSMTKFHKSFCIRG